MKSLLSIVLFAALGAGISGCAYYERDQVAVPADSRVGYYQYGTGTYYPVRSYDSQWDYYRHFNGIDG
jgi:hypothetical protein